MKKINVGIWILVTLLLISCSQPKGISLIVENPLSVQRDSETISLTKEFINNIFPQVKFKSIALLDVQTNKKLITQFIDLNQDGQFEVLLFQSDFKPNAKKEFRMSPSMKSDKATDSNVYAAYVIKGMQDFCWENDFIGYRFYGLEREQEQNTSSGIDIWCKRVAYNMTEKWYAEGVNYHEDNGEGADHYKVGKKRGCGGSGLLYNNEIQFANAFTNWKVLANGPIRTVFELEFSNWESGLNVTEVKQIALDAGHYLNHIHVHYPEMDIVGSHAVGITLREDSEIIEDKDNGIIATWESLGEEKGFLGCGMILSQDAVKEIKTINNEIYMFVEINPDETIEYYAGAAWSESGDINSFHDWQVYLNQQSEFMQYPCKLYKKE